MHWAAMTIPSKNKTNNGRADITDFLTLPGSIILARKARTPVSNLGHGKDFLSAGRHDRVIHSSNV